MIQHIIFDLGNVLVDIHPEKTIAALAQTCNTTSAEMQSFFLSPVHLAFMKGELSPTAFHDAYRRRYGCNITFDDFISAWQKLIGSPKEGISDLITALSQRYTLSICSNTDPLHWRLAQQHGPHMDAFRHVFLSYKLQMLKPSRDIFHHMIRRLQCHPEACIFVDDTLENIETARSLGFAAIHAQEVDVMKRKIEQQCLNGANAQ